jgi:hypothetical protein
MSESNTRVFTPWSAPDFHKLSEIAISITPQSVVGTNPPTYYSHPGAVVNKTVQTAQAEGVFLKGEDSAFFRRDALVRILRKGQHMLSRKGQR